VSFHEGAAAPTEIDIAAVTPEFPHMLTLPQAAMETLLEQKLNEAHVQVAWNHRLADLRSEGGVVLATVEELCGTATGYDVPRWETVVNKTLHFSAPFVVGADGYRSAVRRCLGIESESMGAPELFVVYEFDSDLERTSEMTMVLNESDKNVLWPLPEERCRWSFQWTATAPDGEFPAKERGALWFEDKPVAARTREHLLQMVKSRAPWFNASIGNVDWAADVQFEPHLARKFGRTRCWLAGDAAHQTGPVGMQSMNVGFREGEALATALTTILRRRGSFDLLDAYEQRFRSEWLDLLGKGRQVRPIAGETQPLRRTDAALLSCLPASDAELETMLHRLGLELGPAREAETIQR
jgi:2-polyprenyl-6-methoxyphenol hydroxylase-like FAD-dependent oxidoreductase